MSLLETLRAHLTKRNHKIATRRSLRKSRKHRPIFELNSLERRVLLSAFTGYSYDFEGGSPVTTGWSNTTIATSTSITDWPSTQYIAGPSTLTLSSLPAHGGAVVSFDVYALNCWDSSSHFTLAANGTPVVDVTFTNPFGQGDDSTGTTSTYSGDQSFPQGASFGSGYSPQTDACATGDMNGDNHSVTGYDSSIVRTDNGSDSDDCGCGGCDPGCGADDDPDGDDGDETYTTVYTPRYGSTSDAVYHFTVPIDDGGSTLALAFSGSGASRSIGIDNVDVSLATPEPSGVNADGNGVDLYTGMLDPEIDGLTSCLARRNLWMKAA